MDKEEFWNAFENTGMIEDYLKYKYIEKNDMMIAENGGVNEIIQSERSSNKGNTI